MEEGSLSKKRMPGLRLIWLESFLALAECGSFSKAATKLGCNQSTVSRNIDDLRLWLGFDLVSMTAPLQLSERGRVFVDTAQTVCELLQSSRVSEPAVVMTVKSARSLKINPPN